MMNTTATTEICPNNSKYNNALYISYNIWRLGGFLCALFGISGHCFHIFILLKKKNRKETTSIYFIAIAIFEFIFLFGLYKFLLSIENFSILTN